MNLALHHRTDRCGHRVSIVLANEDHRQGHHRGQVEGFQQHPLVNRPIAEKRHRNSRLAAHLEHIGRPAGHRRPGPDNAIGAKNPEVKVGDMHRAAASLVITALLAEQFRQHARRITALGQDMAMAAMGAGDHVVRPERRTNPDGHRLLAGIFVHGADDLARPRQIGRGLLEPAQQPHPAIQRDIGVGVGSVGGGHGGSDGSILQAGTVADAGGVVTSARAEARARLSGKISPVVLAPPVP